MNDRTKETMCALALFALAGCDGQPRYTHNVCEAERNFLQDWNHHAFMTDENAELHARAIKGRDLAYGRYFDCMEQYSPKEVEK